MNEMFSQVRVSSTVSSFLEPWDFQLSISDCRLRIEEIRFVPILRKTPQLARHAHHLPNQDIKSQAP